MPWAHLDIAGPSRSDDNRWYNTKGGSGFGVRTLVALATSEEFARWLATRPDELTGHRPLRRSGRDRWRRGG